MSAQILKLKFSSLQKLCTKPVYHLILYNRAQSGFEEADRLFALLSAEG